MARRRSAEHAALSRRVQSAFGRRLRHGRRNASQGRIKQDALAKALDVSRTSISNMERGRHRIFLDQAYAAAQALGVTMDQLLPSLTEVFPSTPVMTGSHGSVTDKSVRLVLELVRSIQERAALDVQTQGANLTKRSRASRR